MFAYTVAWAQLFFPICAPQFPPEQSCYYRDVFALAGDWGVRHVVYHVTQLGCREDEAASRRTSAERTVLMLSEMAREKGVTLLVENLPYPAEGKIPLYTNEQYGAFFREYPQMKSIVDVGHAHMNGMDIPAFLQEHGERVLAYHFHNNDGGRDQHNHIFDGTFSYERFASVYTGILADLQELVSFANRQIELWASVANLSNMGGNTVPIRSVRDRVVQMRQDFQADETPLSGDF